VEVEVDVPTAVSAYVCRRLDKPNNRPGEANMEARYKKMEFNARDALVAITRSEKTNQGHAGNTHW